MIPTNKLRWVVRQYVNYYGCPSYDKGGTALIQASNTPLTVMVLQQWWSGIIDNMKIGEWRDVPVEAEK